jgi:hypothetical protein
MVYPLAAQTHENYCEMSLHPFFEIVKSCLKSFVEVGALNFLFTSREPEAERAGLNDNDTYSDVNIFITC